MKQKIKRQVEPIMIDKYGRNIDYLRISLTDRCNLRCIYCMPEEGVKSLSHAEILTYDEILRICRCGAELGIRKIKLTGGEPLVRKGCASLAGQIKAIPGIEKVTLTTNGILLEEQLDDLLKAGIDAINISLDTLDREKYQEITGTDACETVRQAVAAAAESGIRTKVNTVLQSDGDKTEWKALITLAESLPVDVRFIELMPIGYGKENTGVSNLELLDEIRKVYPDIRKDSKIHGNGPAVYYQIPGFTGGIGFISAMHGKFCKNCNRIRLTSTGDLKPCLCYGDTYPLKDLLRNGTEEEIRKQIKRAIEQKPAAHCFEEPGAITEAHQMAQIGG